MQNNSSKSGGRRSEKAVGRENEAVGAGSGRQRYSLISENQINSKSTVNHAAR